MDVGDEITSWVGFIEQVRGLSALFGFWHLLPAQQQNCVAGTRI